MRDHTRMVRFACETVDVMWISRQHLQRNQRLSQAVRKDQCVAAKVAGQQGCQQATITRNRTEHCMVQ